MRCKAGVEAPLLGLHGTEAFLPGTLPKFAPGLRIPCAIRTAGSWLAA
jgi:hypothetical protein